MLPVLADVAFRCNPCTFNNGFCPAHPDHGLHHCSDAKSAAIVLAGAAVDLQGPVVEEAALLVAPVRGVRDRLAQLLAEWPEHPILAQLTAICDRLLGARRPAAGCSIVAHVHLT
jgi:hypothetical protein